MSTTSDSGTMKFEKPEVKEAVSLPELKVLYDRHEQGRNFILITEIDNTDKTVAIIHESNTDKARAYAELFVSAPDLLKENQELKAMLGNAMSLLINISEKVHIKEIDEIIAKYKSL